MDGALSGAVIGAVTAAVVLVFMTFARKPAKCEKCGREQPKVRKPANMQQAMWGGYTCEGCGSELDGRGKVRQTRKG